MSGIVGSYFNTRGSGVVAKLGTDGQVFTSTGAGLKQGFEAAAGGGKVLQIVQDTLGSEFNTSSTTFVEVTGLTCAITPAATSSKILILVHGGMYANSSSGFNYVPTIYRDSTNLAETDAQGFGSMRAGGSTLGAFVSMAYLDSPSSTSEIDYKYYFKISAGTGYMSYNTSATSTMQVIEIGA